MKALLCIILLLTIFPCHADIPHQSDQSLSWKGKAPGGFSAVMTISPHQLNFDQSLIVQLTLTYPNTHKPQWKVLVPHLLSNDSFGAPSFSLISQKLENQKPETASDNTSSQQLTLILSPQIPGTHYLTFYDIPFIPSSAKEKKGEIVSGIIPIQVNASSADFNPALVIAPLMPLSKDLPISITTSNNRKFITNSSLIKEATAHNLDTLHSKSIPWQLFPILITLFVLIIIIKFPSKTQN